MKDTKEIWGEGGNGEGGKWRWGEGGKGEGGKWRMGEMGKLRRGEMEKWGNGEGSVESLINFLKRTGFSQTV